MILNTGNTLGYNFTLPINLAVGGYWPGPPDANTVFPQYHYIDWVKVWRQT